MMTPEQEQEEMRKIHLYVDHFNNGYNIEKLVNDQEVSDKEKKTLRTVISKLKEAKLDSERAQAFEDGRKQYYIDRDRAKLLEKEERRARNQGGRDL